MQEPAAEHDAGIPESKPVVESPGVRRQILFSPEKLEVHRYEVGEVGGEKLYLYYCEI